MKNEHPIYIVSKGRWDTMYTQRALEEMGAWYYVVVEKQEYDKYANVMCASKLLVLDKRYQDDYDTFDELGYAKSKGPGAARNFAWDHSISLGHDWHWVMDDNINGFLRLHKNTRYPCKSAAIFKASEDFCKRFTNVGQAGFEYRFFSGGSRRKKPPYRINTRIYSCNLQRNDVPLRWRGRYNEDTDLSIRTMQLGYCTIMFNAFLQNKAGTQTVKGGNTEDFYSKEGTLPKSEMLAKMHPDITKVVSRYGRDHHHCDYTGFTQQLIPIDPNRNYGEVNEYGMVLRDKVK